MKVLYVEDNPLDSDLARRALLRSAPHIELDIASTFREALENLGDGNVYDLMLTDLRMPDGGGFELLNYVRENQLPLAVVVITGQGDEDTAVAVMKAGADSFLVKRKDYLSHLALTLEGALRSYKNEAARRARTLRVLYLDETGTEDVQIRKHLTQHARYIQLETIFSVEDLNRLLFKEKNLIEFDVVLLDYRMDDLNALEVLKELRQVHRLEIPIVLATSHGDQEVAAQALRLGASDYVVKTEGYLYRLPGVLENAYHYNQLLREQAALRASEERFRSLIENSADGIMVVDEHIQVVYISPSSERVLGFAVDELLGKSFLDWVHPDDLINLEDKVKVALESPGELVQVEFRARHKSGEWRWVDSTGVNLIQNQAVQGIVINFRDITDRYLAEERIFRQVQRLQALREIDTAITIGDELCSVLETILRHVTDLLGVHAADILLYDPDSEQMQYSVSRGFQVLEDFSVRVNLSTSLAGRSALEQRTIRYPDPEITAEMVSQKFLTECMQAENFKIYFAAPLYAKNEIKGVLEVYHRDELKPDLEWFGFLETLAGQAAIAIDNSQLVEGLIETNIKLEQAYDQTLQGWIRFLDLRDMETGDHTQRLINMTVKLARRMGVGEDELEHIRRGTLVHDIGKIGVPDQILHKPGPLNETEWEQMKQHPIFAYEMLSKIDYLRPVLDIPYCHHEKLDGSGYPRGLREGEIPLAARIFAVVDIYDALSHDRVYRKAWKPEQVLEHIRMISGSHLDPQVVDVFLEMLNEQVV